MFVGMPGHTAALLSQQIAGRLKRAALLELLSGANNGTLRDNENQQDRSFTLQAERAIGKRAAAIRRAGSRH
jgi:hypothetical protein